MIETIDSWLEKKIGFENFKGQFDRLIPLFTPFKNWAQENNVKIISIGGTNGKGETAYASEYLCQNQKISCALWTSPHLQSVCERIRFNGNNISSDEFLDLAKDSYQDFLEYQLSYYEFLFFIFWKACQKKKLQVIILECGLGGRLDAINLFDPDIVGIISIGRDHESILGRGYRNILREKIALSRSKKKLFTSFALNYLNQLTEIYCLQNQIEWQSLNFPPGTFYSIKNKKMAKELVRSLFPELKFPEDIQWPQFPGRWEVANFDKLQLMMIGAHNLDGIRFTMEALAEHSFYLQSEYICLALSQRNLQEVEAILKILLLNGGSRKIKLIQFNHFKSLDFDQIKVESCAVINWENLDIVYNWEDFFKQRNSTESSMLVLGSYYFIGQVKDFLSNRISSLL